MLSVSLRPHLEARLRVEAEKRVITPEAFAADILSAVLEADRTAEGEAAAQTFLERTRESVNHKPATERLQREHREDLPREEMKFERLQKEGKRGAYS